MEKKVLELFSGSKTVAGVFEKNGWKSFTVDNNADLSPSLCYDICHISPGMLPAKIDFIWASPDCSKFSRATNSSHWEKITNKYRQYTYLPKTAEAKKALLMVEATTFILSWYPNTPFVIENPIGRIHHTAAFKKLGHYRYSVNYADFGFPYSKETYLFTNLWLPFSTKKVPSSMPGLRSINSKSQRSKVPPLLIQTILNYIS
jgi:site-specific DNA-cytosine methylase